YRTRAQWRVAPRKGSLRPSIGYHARNSHEVVDVEHCPILVPELERALHTQRADLADAAILPQQVHACAGDGGATAFEHEPVMRRVHDEQLTTSAVAFFQGNGYLVDRLVTAVLGDARPEHAFDLYAGVGLFALPLARRGTRVLAVESDPEALR